MQKIFNQICSLAMEADAKQLLLVLEQLGPDKRDEFSQFLTNGDTALMFIYKNITQNKDIIFPLIDASSALYIEDSNANTIMSICIKKQDNDTLSYCLGKNPLVVNFVNLDGLSLVDWAMIYKNEKALDIVLSKTPRLNTFNYFILSENSVLYAAADLDPQDPTVISMAQKVRAYLDNESKRLVFEEQFKNKKADNK